MQHFVDDTPPQNLPTNNQNAINNAQVNNQKQQQINEPAT